MAYDRDFLKVSWLFAIQNSDEIAVTSLNFSHPEGAGFPAEIALGEIDIAVVGPLLLARMQTFLGGSPINWADYSELRAVRIAAVLLSGTEIDPAKQFDDSTPGEGGSLNVVPQASVVLSTRSGSSAGAANFGRMYLPHTQWSQSANSARGNPGVVDAVATAAATFVNGCNTDLNASVTTSVQAMIMTQVATSVSKVITQIAMGDITDTQRRRRNKLPELYQFRAIP